MNVSVRQAPDDVVRPETKWQQAGPRPAETWKEKDVINFAG